MSHRLDPLLRPKSIAVLGASERRYSVGRQTMENLLAGKFAGQLYAVNPGYESVCGVSCYPSLKSLPESVEHVIFAIGDGRIESALDEVIDHGARAATIMSSLVLEDDQEPRLQDRVSKKLVAADLLVCGGNGMGFYNFRDGVWACGFDTRRHRPEGNVALISHSGSGMSGIVDVDHRIDFNLAVSTGHELTVAMDDYLDFALELPETRVVGLFMETARNPSGLIRALEKANTRKIPIVALKVGSSELAAKLAVSHSGAIAGRDAAYQALFDRYGVQRVDDMDELATALIMFAQPHRAGPGGLVAIHDSGGERQLLIDLAEKRGLELAQVGQETEAKLDELLDPGLPPVNPLDAWGTGGPDADHIMAECLAALMMDSEASVGAVVHDRAPEGGIYSEYLDYLRRGHEASGKPAFLVSTRQGTGTDPQVVSATREGFPVLDGLSSFITGARCLFAYRDFLDRQPDQAPDGPSTRVSHWRQRLASGSPLNEMETGELLTDFGIAANVSRYAEDMHGAALAAAETGYPVVVKTARQDLFHKTEVGGVVLDVASEEDLASVVASIQARHGPGLLISSMVQEKGVEMMLGLVNDEQFGPLVIMGFGGIHVEQLGDVVSVLPPFDSTTAKRLLDKLKLKSLLEAHRGEAPPDLDGFCQMAARFSVMAERLGSHIQEADINPVIVHAQGCIAVDGLIIGRNPDAKE